MGAPKRSTKIQQEKSPFVVELRVSPAVGQAIGRLQNKRRCGETKVRAATEGGGGL